MSAPLHTTVATPSVSGGTAPAANDRYPEVIVGGIKAVCLSRAQLASLMVQDCVAAKSGGLPARTVFAANGHAIALAALDAEFQAMFDEADIVHADGQAIVFASRLLTTTPIAERSATTDFIHDAARAASEHGLSFFLFGATEEVNAGAAAMLAERYPDLRIAGRRHGYFSLDEEEEICEEINRSGANVVWTGLGVPLEYEFAARNKHRLNAGWIVTCGGCFNFLSGDYVRAPHWMQSLGFEWLHRLVREPRRLFWRYVVTNPIAAVMLLARTTQAHQGARSAVPAAMPQPMPQFRPQTRLAR